MLKVPSPRKLRDAKGNLHRIDGPAVTTSGTKCPQSLEWWVRGVQYFKLDDYVDAVRKEYKKEILTIRLR